MRDVLILGGYGNFGKRIAVALTKAGVPVIVAGRNEAKAAAFVETLPAGLARSEAIDVETGLDAALGRLKPAVAVNTCGPFQAKDYAVAESCIRAGVHYVDLADGRDFVTGIRRLDAAAQAAGVAVISGASTVPGLSSAVLGHFRAEFGRIDDLTYGISPGQAAERGLATTRGILTYVGRPLAPVAGQVGRRFGWQDIYRQEIPGLGKRWMANCDIPDLDLLPQFFGLKSIRFSAGLELGLLHLGLFGLSWLVRLGLPLNLPGMAGFLLEASNAFDNFGTADGGMFIRMTGTNPKGAPLTLEWYVVAKDGDGPQIPTIPAILLAKRLAVGAANLNGAMPCLGLIDLADYLRELAPYRIGTAVRRF